MENQHNKTPQAPLLALRNEIDAVDNQIIELLNSRMKIISRVGELKKNNNENFFIRSSREADMIKDLIKKSDANFPKSTIISIWRKIITAANMHEQKLRIAIHNPKNIPDYSYLVREYYSDYVPIISHDSATNIVAEIEKGEAQIGVFALPKANHQEDYEKKEGAAENWWIGLANNKLGIKVFAKIPFIESKNLQEGIDDEITLVAVAVKSEEKSSEDNSLLYIEVKKEVSWSQIMAGFIEHGLSAKILKSVKLPQVDDVIFYLVELGGFYDENDEAIKNFSKSKIRPYTKIIGSYALPIKI
jgi:chorismate mutase